MWRIDNSSAAATLPTPKPIGQPGYFTAGTIGGVSATIVEADFLNQVQEELMAILAADGMAPSKTGNNQVITAILDLIAKNTRKRLSGPLNLYVSPTGNDSNNGLTPAAAFATPQAAWNYIAQFLDCGGNTITINLAHGTYSFLNCQGQPLGQGTVQILGDINSPAAVTIQSATANMPALTAGGGAIVYLSGISLTTTGNLFSNCLASNNGSFVGINGPINFGPCTGAQIVSAGSSRVIIDHSYTINGGAPSHYDAGQNGSISTLGVPSSNMVLTVSGTPTFSIAFAQVDTNGIIEFVTASLSYNGGAHGKHYQVSQGGQVTVIGGGVNYFPGDLAGTADATTFGYYSG